MQVVANCLWVIQEAGLLDGPLTRELVISLLNHIRSFSDWAQCLVLDIVAQYQPASEAERFDILEVGGAGRGALGGGEWVGGWREVVGRVGGWGRLGAGACQRGGAL